VDRRATVRGKALWWSGVDASSRWRRHIYKVDFIVDGRTLYTDNTWPYSFHRTQGWDSRTVATGRHMLTVLTYGTHHYRARKRIPIRVSNPRLRLALTGAISGGAVSGRVTIGIRVDEPIDRVALYVDGAAVSRDGAAPYTVHWDTTSANEGGHSLLIYARTSHGRRAAVRVSIVVANAATFPSSLASNWAAHQSTPDL